MNTKVYKLKSLQLIIMLIVSIVFIAVIFVGLSNYQAEMGSVETDRIEKTVERYAIQCYATEGAYPPNLKYLSDNYGLIINEEKYIYQYEPVAENIKPIVNIFIRFDNKE